MVERVRGVRDALFERLVHTSVTPGKPAPLGQLRDPPQATPIIPVAEGEGVSRRKQEDAWGVAMRLCHQPLTASAPQAHRKRDNKPAGYAAAR